MGVRSQQSRHLSSGLLVVLCSVNCIFPNHKTLEDFKFEAQPTVNRVLVSELMRGQYIEKRESVILIGHPGAGKTHNATALAISACGQGKKVRFHRGTELITLLMEAPEERQLMRMKNQLAKLDLLILDELGYVPARNREVKGRVSSTRSPPPNIRRGHIFLLFVGLNLDIAHSRMAGTFIVVLPAR